MSPWLCLLFACVLGLTATLTLTVPPYDLEDAELHFERFIEEHNRHYADEYEKKARFLIFKDNLEKANRFNERSDHAVFGITQFMDLSEEEFTQFYTGLNFDHYSDDGCSILHDNDIEDVDVPESFDWRDHSVVTPVKYQKKCGGCYAFSCTGNIEGQYAIKYKKLISLSEQQIIDCDKRSIGCLGGLMTLSFRSLIEEGGMEGEEDYPYKAVHQHCQFDASKIKVKVTDCHAYDLSSQQKIKQLLYKTGPISIAIQSAGLSKYHGGIISDELCDVGYANHAVLLVGYGKENNDSYWIVKNSWNASWGEHGYLRMRRGENAKSCSMMNTAMSSAIIA